MRIVHLSDTHLGYGTYSKLDHSEGINQREADFYNAFRQSIDKAIELKPDAIIHAGDLFDVVRPQNRAIEFAMKQLLRLSEAGIETVLISGNHSTPKMKETGSIFGIFEHLPHMHAVHDCGTTRVVVGDMTVHAIPHSTSPPLAQLVSELRPSKETRYNIAVLHAGITGSKTYKMDEFNEQAVPVEAAPADFDYIALGHYHRYAKVRENMYYSGSTERLGFGEVDQDKGVIELNLATSGMKFHKLAIRDMIDLEEVDAKTMVASEVLATARDRVSGAVIDDRIVRLVVKNVSQEAYRSLDVPAIRKLGASAVHFELKIERAEAAARREAEDAQIGSLTHEFQRYVSGLDLPEAKKKALLERGGPYFTRDDE